MKFLLFLIYLIVSTLESDPNDPILTFEQEFGGDIDKDLATIKLECPSNYSAISCGFESLADEPGDRFDVYWQAYPLDDKTGCEGHDDCIGSLQTVCANNNLLDIIDPLYIVQKQTDKNGQSDAVCPDNYVVSGCGVAAIDNPQDHYEPFKKVYPNYDGKSCHCYNSGGAICYSTCIKKGVFIKSNNKYINIKNQTFPKKSHFQRISCDGRQLAFGCGIDLATNKGWEKYPKYYVDPNDRQSCIGYSYYEYTLFAICGEFNSYANYSIDIINHA